MSEILGFDASVFAAWAQAFGALGAFTAAGVAVGIAVYDSKRRDREREEEKSGQALTVTAAVERISSDSRGRSDFFASSVYHVVVVHNNGSDPITDVMLEDVTVLQAGGSDGDNYSSELTLSEWSIADHLSYSGPVKLFSVVPARSSPVSARLKFKDSTNLYRINTNTAQIVFTFHDSHGVRWRRIDNGTPVRVVSHSAPHPKRRRWYVPGRGLRGHAWRVR